MTTYELPPEPPVGTRVRDAEGNIWEHIPSSDRRGWTRTNGEHAHSWSAMLTVVAPLTLIEPDPWPTAPLIVATREGAHLTPAHRVWVRSDEVRSIYTSITDSHEAHPGDTLTNVVPVTVVPTAEWEALRDAVKALGYETTGTTGMPGSLLDTALNLLSATDALGVEL